MYGGGGVWGGGVSGWGKRETQEMNKTDPRHDRFFRQNILPEGRKQWNASSDYNRDITFISYSSRFMTPRKTS